MAAKSERKCVLLLSPLKQFCGNTVHACRLQSAIECEGFKCLLHDPSTLNLHEFVKLVVDFEVRMCIGIHALHSGSLLHVKDCPAPFGIVLSGTDLNGWYTSDDQVHIINETLNRARFVLCLSQGGVEKAKDTWPQVKGKISVINHGVLTNPSLFSFLDYCRENDIPVPRSPVIFTLICGIRPVKDPIFGVQAFIEFCTKYGDKMNNSILLVIGPSLSEEYFFKFKAVIEGRKNIIYIPGLAVEDVHAVIKQSFLVFNTSVNEGFPQAIMEACMLHVPVMVRNNTGNIALITDQQNGLVFSSTQEFADGAASLLTDKELRTRLVDNAYKTVIKSYSIEQERQTICDQIKQVLESQETRNGER